MTPNIFEKFRSGCALRARMKVGHLPMQWLPWSWYGYLDSWMEEANKLYVSARGEISRISVMGKSLDGISECFDLRDRCWWLIAHSVLRTKMDGQPTKVLLK